MFDSHNATAQVVKLKERKRGICITPAAPAGAAGILSGKARDSRQKALMAINSHNLPVLGRRASAFTQAAHA